MNIQKNSELKFGVITKVSGNESHVGIYKNKNDSFYIFNGEILNGPKIGSFLTINQNDIKIIAIVVSEQLIDEINKFNSDEFDNRYRDNSFKRLIVLETKGVIKGREFYTTSQYVPMIGNEVTITTKDDLDLIFTGEETNEEKTISIGKTVLEDYKINLSINRLFSSHIGIFGNTGSGKSNTLHKLYLELFRTNYKDKILEKSKFIIIDFSGEYATNESFNITSEYKKIFKINKRLENDYFQFQKEEKIPVDKTFIMDVDILTILFEAKPWVQAPFLRNAIQKYKKLNNEITKFIIWVFKEIIKSLLNKNNDTTNFVIEIIGIIKNILEKTDKKNFTDLDLFRDCNYRTENYNKNIISGNCTIYDGKFTDVANKAFQSIENEINDSLKYLSELNKFSYFLEIYMNLYCLNKKTKIEYIHPLITRIKSSLKNLDNFIEIDNSNVWILDKFPPVTIISLVNADNQMKILIPMLLAKMFYDNQKLEYSKGRVFETKHLIIDEAHNILKRSQELKTDEIKDYTINVFDEIIKEGRKFGFFLTLASQRPIEISSTILSQLQNYFIHRIINEKDIAILEKSISTLDKMTFKKIPALGKGEVILNGIVTKIPLLIKVDKEEKKYRPKSDDINLFEIWEHD